MQEFKIYVSAASAVGEPRDYVNARSEKLPTLVKGVETCLKLRLFSAPDGSTPYPIEQLERIASWEWVMDKDFNAETNFVLVADNENITVQSVTEELEETEYTYTEISVPLPNTNTEELAAWLGTEKSKTGLSAELVGYDAEGASVFILHVGLYNHLHASYIGCGDCPTLLVVKGKLQVIPHLRGSNLIKVELNCCRAGGCAGYC